MRVERQPHSHRGIAQSSAAATTVRAWGARRRDVIAAWMVSSAERLHRGKPYIQLDYAPTEVNAPRYGHGRPSHGRLVDAIRSYDANYRESLELITTYRSDLESIGVDDADPAEPSWYNPYLPGLDGAALYSFMRARAPKQYVEVGSGHSTKFAARAKRDGGLSTRIVSIDPHPRAEIDQLCDLVIRAPFESAELGVFSPLDRGDIVFFDGSHRVFMNSDTTAFFLDVLPALRPGVLVGIHDIFLPEDYPREFASRWYSEQYLLAAYLLAPAGWLRPVLASYACRDSPLVAQIDAIWRRQHLPAVGQDGVAFWLEICD